MLPHHMIRNSEYIRRVARKTTLVVAVRNQVLQEHASESAVTYPPPCLSLSTVAASLPLVSPFQSTNRCHPPPYCTANNKILAKQMDKLMCFFAREVEPGYSTGTLDGQMLEDRTSGLTGHSNLQPRI